MDPLSVTASVIAVVTLAWQSSRATYELVDGISGAPKAIADAKSILSETKGTLTTLKDTLESGSNDIRTLDPVLKKIDLQVAIQSVQGVCDDFDRTIKSATSHSTESKFSKRDRLAVTFLEPKLLGLSRRLGACQRTISLALESIILITSCHTSTDVKLLGDRFSLQETALTDLQKQLRDAETGLQQMTLDNSTLAERESRLPAEREADLQLNAILQNVSQEALSATRLKHTGQSFGDTETENSKVYQGIVGTRQDGVEQSFGKLKASNGSVVGQGQMDAASFAMMFGK